LPPLLGLVWLAFAAGSEAVSLWRGFGVLAGLCGPCLAGLHATRTVVRERQQRTLESLLSLPSEPREILRAKYLAALGLAGWSAAAVIALTVLGAVRGTLHPAAVICSPLVAIGWTLAATGFGLWLSVRCRTQVRAFGWFLGAVVPVVAVPLLLGQMTGHWHCAATVPPASFWFAMVPSEGPAGADSAWVVLGAASATAMGIAFALAAGRRFALRE
jgi:ABC-type Na+ efflux pump permease subunit